MSTPSLYEKVKREVANHLKESRQALKENRYQDSYLSFSKAVIACALNSTAPKKTECLTGMITHGALMNAGVINKMIKNKRFAF